MAHTHPLSQYRDSEDPLQHEVKPAVSAHYDDPLQAAAAPGHAKAELEQGRDTLIAHSKPIRIPNSILDELKDPEATPTAANAFPNTPTSSSSVLARPASPARSQTSDDEEVAATDRDRAPISSSISSAIPLSGGSSPHPVKPHDIAALQAKVCKAAARGDLESLISLLHPPDIEDDSTSDYPSSFALVNSPTSSGLTPLLEAASHGHLHIVKHLLNEGAVRELEDVEGENAFLKASYRGHLDVMRYLVVGEEKGTDINAADRQGWTALHNAASKGYLEVVMWLAENGASIDATSMQGYTPLVNAASKGHLPIIHYLLSRHLPDPFIRNAYNETAYDVAVATFELGIADTLASYESQLWQDGQLHSQPDFSNSSLSSNPIPSSRPYNLLGMHITVPIVVYENQRLDLRWLSRTKRTLSHPIAAATSRSSDSPTAVKFTSAALSRRDGHASSELPPSYDGINPTGKWTPVRRDNIKLPTIMNPRQIRLPITNHTRPSIQRNTSSARNTNKSSTSSSSHEPTSSSPSTSHEVQKLEEEEPEASEAEEAWFWLSSQFFVDLSPSNVNAEQGWQYAKSFDEVDDNWSSEIPNEVVRILSGGEIPNKGVKWVRRRRWARIMRRRIDIPHWGFDDDPVSPPSGHTEGDEHLPSKLHQGSSEMPATAVRDYLERAQYFAGSHIRSHARVENGTKDWYNSDSDETMSLRSIQTVIAESQNGEEELGNASARKVIARLERALQELHEGIEGDHDEVRKLQAVTLAEIFQERLDELRTRVPQLDVDDNDADSFRYPGADDDSELDETSSISTSLRSASLYSPISHGSPASFRRSSDAASLPYGSPASRQRASLRPAPSNSSLYRPDLSRQLSSNPDFRVPTSEEPRNHVPGSYTLGRTIFDSDNINTTTSTSTHMTTRSNIQWEPDENATECRRCQRKFTFFVRKHHCRKCGLVVCANCSSHHDFLRMNQVIMEPGTTTTSSNSTSSNFDTLYSIYNLEGGFYRTCDVCHQEVTRQSNNEIDSDLLLAPNYFTSPRLGISAMGPSSSSNNTAMPTPTLAHYTQALDNQHQGSSHGTEGAIIRGALDGSPMQRSVSDMSELGECPVCGTNLEDIPDKTEQEAHVQHCLESGTSTRVQDNRYLVFTLPESSPLVGTDCLICFESYEAGEQIGRLSCLCHFHRHCIANWLSRGKSCPVHAR